MKKETVCDRCGAPNGRARKWCFDCGAYLHPELSPVLELVAYALSVAAVILIVALALFLCGGCSAPFTAEFSEPSSAGSAGVAGYPLTMPQGGAGAGAGTSSGGAAGAAGGGSSAGDRGQAGDPSVEPGPTVACSRDAWTASAFVPGALQGETPSSAIDDSPVSRWSSGEPQAAGQWFAVELGQTEHLVGVRLHAAAAGDMPGAVALELDGVRVSVTATARPGVLELDFPRTPARRFRLVLEQAAAAWWSLNDLEAVCQ